MEKFDILKRDYSHFLLHLLWSCCKGNRKLIFGMAEAYPVELGMPEELEEQEIIKSGRYRFYYKRVCITVENLAGMLENINKTSHMSLFEGDSGKIVEFMGNVVINPDEDSYVLSHEIDGATEKAPFISRLWGQCRLRSYFSEVCEEELLTILRKKEAADAIQNCLMWNINLYPDLIGSFHIVLPNPIYRKVLVKAVPGDDKNHVLVQFIPREGRNISELEVYCREGKAYGLSLHKVIADTGAFLIDIKGDIDKFSLIVTSPIYGLLEWQRLANFIMKIDNELFVAHRNKRINVPNSAESLEVTEYIGANDTRKTESLEGNLLQKRYIKGYQYRKKLHDAAKTGQKIFTNGDDEAKEYMRELVSRARHNLMIIDPYISVNEIYSYIYTRQYKLQEITLVTSAEHLGKPYENNDDAFAGTKIKNYEVLYRELHDHAEELAGANIIVMKGKPIFHDRFIILDKECYFSGNSLNHIGSRISCIVKLANPDEVRELIREVFLQQDKIEDFNTWYINKTAEATCSEGKDE